MAKNSFKDIAIAGLLGSLIIVVFVAAYAGMSTTTDVSDLNTSSLGQFEAYDEILEEFNQTTTTVTQDVSTDKNLFDVIGGLTLSAIGAIKTMWSGFSFLTTNTSNLLAFLGINTRFVSYIIAVILISLASLLLFKYYRGIDDEK